VIYLLSDGPVFASEPESQPADVGDSVTLTCDIRGNPTPTVYWKRQGDDRILSTHKSIRIATVTESDFTSFTCSGASFGYDTVSRNVYVLRKGPPTILSPFYQSARYGEMATIECLVRSIPPPTEITWTKNGQIIDFNSMQRSAITVSYIISTIMIRKNTDLRFLVHTLYDTREICC
jgi:hypothetical protein